MSVVRDWSHMVGSMQREMDRLVSDLTARKPPPASFAPRPWQPSVDCFETGAEVVFLVELAGMTAEEIEVSIQGSILSVSGRRTDPRQGDRRSYQVMEICWGLFERRIEIPAAVDPDSVKASYGDGLLEITMAKTPAGPRQLKVKG